MAPTPTELILDRAHNAVVSMDERGTVTYWNPSAERMFGISRHDAIGSVVAELILPERFRELHRAGLERFLREGIGRVLDRRIEMAALRSDRSEFPVEMTISALRDGERWTFTAFIQDIAERHEAERERDRLVEELQRSVRRSQMRFDAIVGSLSDPVTIRDPADRLVYANRAALAHLGFSSLEELQSRPPRDIMADYTVTREDGTEVRMEDIPSVRILRGQAPEPLLIRTVHRESGQQRWLLLKSAPLTDDGGSVEATIMIIEDVTERRQAEWQGRFLAQASEVLASSLDYEQTLRNVAELAVPELADWCAVDLIDEDGDRQQVAVAHVDPGRLRLAEELREYVPDSPDADTGLGLVFRTGEPVLYPEIDDEMLKAAALDDRHLSLLQAVGMRSVAIVPMRLGRRTLGAMTLVSAESGRVLDKFEVALGQETAARAAVAIENARIYSERSLIAHTLQQSLLPEELPEIRGYELAAAYIPAIESSDVGGDFYDVWRVDGGWMLVVGDVTGKGVQAATLTSLVRHTLRVAGEFETRPAALLARVDAILKKQRARSICTALCMRLEEHRLVCAVGGHPLPIYVDDTGARPVGEHGPLLGGFRDATWQDSVVKISPAATLVAYTDGVTDAVGEDGTRFGLKRLQETLAGCKDRSASQVVARLVSLLDEFQSGAHADDTAALVLRRSPKTVASASRPADRVQPADDFPQAARSQA